MKKLCVSLFVFSLLTPALMAVTIADRGVNRSFDIPIDQAAVWQADGSIQVESVSGLQDLPGLKARLSSRARADGRKQSLVLYEKDKPQTPENMRILSGDVLVVFRQPGNLASKGKALGVSLRNPRSGHDGRFGLASAPNAWDAIEFAARLRTRPGVVSAEPILLKKHTKKFLPNDTHFPDQWHLRNTGQDGAVPGIDVNITNVWSTYTGAGISIGIIDDGLQTTHPDISPNVDTVNDYDWNEGDNDPNPDVGFDYHGTACGGVAAGKGNNNLGIAGAAYDADLVGLRLIAGFVGDVEEAEALSHSNSIIQIKSNSWGPADDAQTLEAPGALTRAALADGVSNGRNGLGTLYAWAGGNGLDANDNANYDGYANSIYTISVAALGDDGMQAWYSEPGACHVVTAPSSDDNQGITTVDLEGEDGYNYTGASPEMADTDYTQEFGGTSSATPLVAGILALMLDANPLLGWRDVQEILIMTANKIHAADGDWVVNGGGFNFNHKYGAGLVDADAAVTAALTWTNLGTQLSEELSATGLGQAIPDNDVNGVTQDFDFSATALRVEHVTVEVDIDHNTRGDLAISITSPDGTVSQLTEEHGDNGNDYSSWIMSSTHHWGEDSWGTWTVKVADEGAGTAGTWNNVKVTLYGALSGAASNRPPSLSVPPSQDIHVTNTLAFNVTATDIDDDSIILSASNLPSGATFSTVTSNGNASSAFSWEPATNQVGTYTVYFTAGDKDGTNTRSVVINAYDLSGAIDLGGYTLLQYNSSQSVPIPASTLLTEGGYIVIGRDAGEGAFQSFWGVTFGPNVTYINSRDTMPLINGGETFELKDDLGVTVDGETGLALSSGAVQRNDASDDGTLAGSWTEVAEGSAHPGSGATGNGSSGVVISEYSDASGSGNYIYEFVELYFDGNAPPAPEPPEIDVSGGVSQSVVVSNNLQFTVTANEANGDTVTLLAEALPSGATFGGATGTAPINALFDWTPDMTGSFTAVFTASDVDGTVTQVVDITVNEVFVPGPGLDISGYELKQYDSSQSYVFPSNTMIEGGSYLVLSRNADEAAFETHWGVTFDASVTFINSGGSLPQINGAETYELLDDLAAPIDGITGQALSSGNTAQRNNTTDDSTIAGSWTMSAVANADPGSGANGNGAAGLVINEYSDASGDFNMEFVELYYDAAGGPSTNDLPVLDGLSNQTVTVSNLLSFSVSASETDGDEITLSASNLPANATFPQAVATSAVNSTFDFTPDLSQTGQTYMVYFTATDKDGSDEVMIEITVLSPAPPAPPSVTVTSGSSQSVTISNNLQFTVSATEPDGDVVTLLAQSLPGGATFPGATGVAPIEADFDWTPGITGEFTAVFTATDADGTYTQTVTITVNDIVVLGPELDISGYELKQYDSSQSFTFPSNTTIDGGGYLVVARDTDQAAFETHWGLTLDANVTFVNSGNSMPLINGAETYELLDDLAATVDGISGQALTSGNTVQRNNTTDDSTIAGSWTMSDVANADPGSGANGNGTAGLVINEYSDADGDFHMEFVELFYDSAGGEPATNVLPTLEGLSNQTVTVSNLLSFSVSASESDGDEITLSASNLPANATFPQAAGTSAVNSTFNFTPDLSQTGQTYMVYFSATDKDGGDEVMIEITVLSPAPPAPPSVTVTSGASQSVTISNNLQFTVSATEPDGDVVTLLAQSLPGGATFPGVTGTAPIEALFDWTPGMTGEFTAVFTATDADGTDTQTVTITVNDIVIPGPNLDITGYELKQYDSSQSFVLPSNTTIDGGGYLVLARNADEAAFEAHWGVTFGPNVTFINSGGSLPQINGAETYELLDDLAATVDGITGQALTSGNTAQRNNTTDDSTIAGSWTMSPVASADPGSGANGSGFAGLVINEYSDAAGDFNMEFVELYYDSGVGPATNFLPALAGLSNQTVTVSNLLSFSVSASESDGDEITLSASNLPVNATFPQAAGTSTVNSTFDFTPELSQTGQTYMVYFSATDKDGGDEVMIEITVLSPTPPAPPSVTVTSGASQSVTISNNLQFTVAANEPDGDVVTLLTESLPGGATFPGATGVAPIEAVFDWTPTMTGTFTAVFTASDVDGTDTQTVTITVNEAPVPGDSLDLTDYRLLQYTAPQTYIFPTNTTVNGGQYIIVSRDSDLAAFETFWNVSIDTNNVIFLNAGNSGISINGDETFELQDETLATIDGETGQALSSGSTAQRNSADDDGTLPGSWTMSDETNATPGSGASGSGTAGLVISEYSDASGTGNFIYEFVELYYDGIGGGEPPTDDDGDGIPNDWEMQFSGTTTGLTAGADDDGDGFTNTEEWNADTVPTNGASYHQVIAIVGGPGLLSIDFPASTNREYDLDFSTILPGNWSNLVSGSSATGTTMSLEYPDELPWGLYRVRVNVPAP